MRICYAPTFRSEKLRSQGHLRSRRLAITHLSPDAAIRRGLVGSFSFRYADVEQRRLCCGMFTQFGHLIQAAFHRLLLPSLVPALCLVLLSLLPCVFFLTLCKC